MLQEIETEAEKGATKSQIAKYRFHDLWISEAKSAQYT